MGLIGDLTVTEARALGEDLLAEIAETTKLSSQLVRRRLDGAHGNARLRSVFVDEWPDLAGELAKETVAGARAKNLSDKIARVTTLDCRTVEFVLDQTSARTRIHNAFEFAWPGKVDRDKREELLRLMLSNQTVGTIRHYDLFAELAEVFGLKEQDVRDDLSAHRAHKLLKNIRASTATEPAPNERDVASAELVDPDEERMVSLLPRDGAAIGNGSLRDKLGWDEDKYFLVRGSLLQKGMIWLGKGRGGSVTLASGWVDSRRKELYALVPEDGTAVSNVTLMRQLGWDEPIYADIKKQLVDEGLLQVGRGRGGSVLRALSPLPATPPTPNNIGTPAKRLVTPPIAETPMPEPIDVFFSYSHKDEVLRDELATHLKLLERAGVIRSWHDRRIGAGENWKAAIDTNLERAHAILLLVSADFLASDYCYDVEMKRALARHQAGEAAVLPVILRSCNWSRAPFAKLQALPRDAKPVTSWANRDDAWTNVAAGIETAVCK